MARKIAFVATIVGMIAALAEITSFVMDKGGIILGKLPQNDTKTTDAKAPVCPDRNPVTKLICEDKRDGTIPLSR